jgi:hypothetical protein
MASAQLPANASKLEGHDSVMPASDRVAPPNVEKTMAAPVSVVVARDLAFLRAFAQACSASFKCGSQFDDRLPLMETATLRNGKRVEDQEWSQLWK